MARTKKEWIETDPEELDNETMSFWNKVNPDGSINKDKVHYCTERRYQELIKTIYTDNYAD